MPISFAWTWKGCVLLIIGVPVLVASVMTVVCGAVTNWDGEATLAGVLMCSCLSFAAVIGWYIYEFLQSGSRVANASRAILAWGVFVMTQIMGMIGALSILIVISQIGLDDEAAAAALFAIGLAWFAGTILCGYRFWPTREDGDNPFRPLE